MNPGGQVGSFGATHSQAKLSNIKPALHICTPQVHSHVLTFSVNADDGQAGQDGDEYEGSGIHLQSLLSMNPGGHPKGGHDEVGSRIQLQSLLSMNPGGHPKGGQTHSHSCE